MIKSIKIKNVATYTEKGILIDNLKKINFIYGTNGSGKTTISNFLLNSRDQKYNESEIQWDGQEEEIQVYNKRFRDDNFGNGNIPGVFTLGMATKQQIEKIDEMKNELNETKDELKNKKVTLERQNQKKQEEEDEIKEYVWKQIYKKNEAVFKEAFSGYLTKDKFKQKIIDIYKKDELSALTREEIEEKCKTIFGDPPINLNEYNLISNMDIKDIDYIESNEIWSKRIVGKQDLNIAKLIEKLNMSDWINQGRRYVSDSNVCPFCQQKIDDDFKKEIEEFFDESFENDIAEMKQLSKKYDNTIIACLEKLKLGLNDVDGEKKKLDVGKYGLYLENIENIFKLNRVAIMDKVNEPSKNVKLDKIKQYIEKINNLLQVSNSEIKKNNNIVLNFKNEKQSIINNIWNLMVDEEQDAISKSQKIIEGLQKGIENIKKCYDELTKKKEDLEKKIAFESKNITSVQPTIDEINRILKGYGFINFKIVSSEDSNYYQIQRNDGKMAETSLSEGEVTFITFLYFLQLAKGSIKKDNVKNDKILVIDDPISSLDSNILFIVSSLIKEIGKCIRKNEKSSNEYENIQQMIVLTHNVYFHKEVSFIDGRSSNDKNTNFWILRKNNGVTYIEDYQNENPIESSYELLWREVKSNNSTITIQNTMRRIIENYFKILGKYGDDKLILAFDGKEKQEICRSLLCWINDGSHCISDDLFIESQADLISMYKQVFREIFEETDQIQHYNMMMGIN